MSRRKNRATAPNLPQETLERARRQAAIERGELPPEPEPEPEAPVADETPASELRAGHFRTVSASQRRAAARATARPATGARVPRRRQPELDQETISDLLENPTIVVTEEELKRDYGYVMADLRNMAVLAGVLVVTLVVLATVLPR